MGVEDRLRVARNVRAEEENAGLLGGSIAITHAVTIDLTSSLQPRLTWRWWTASRCPTRRAWR